MQQHRDRDVVGQVGHHRGRRGRQVLDPQRVGGDHGQRGGSLRHPGGRTVAWSAPASSGSISTAITRRRRLEQAEGQRAEAGADLQHDVVRTDPGRRDDAADGVGVGDEVLAALLARPQPEPPDQLADRAGVEQTGGRSR